MLFVTDSKAWTDTFDEVSAKANQVRVGLKDLGIKLRAGSALWQLLRQADTLSLVWAQGGKPGNEVVWDTLHVNRLADAVINLLDEPGIELALKRMAGSVMQPEDRSFSQGKAALWELILLSFLKNRGFSVKAAEPDILVDFGFGEYPIACKKSWSEKGVEDHIRKAAKQLAPFRNGGLIALNLDDLVPPGYGLTVPTLDQAGIKLSLAQQAFIEKHKGLLAKAVIEGKCEGFIISTTVNAVLTEEKTQPNLVSNFTVWSDTGSPEVSDRFIAFQHAVSV
jgi:hypothetical protein